MLLEGMAAGKAMPMEGDGDLLREGAARMRFGVAEGTTGQNEAVAP